MIRHILIAVIIVAVFAPSARAGFDNTAYAEFLNTYVRTGRVIDGINVNAVDYERLAGDASNPATPYPRLLAQLAVFDPDTLETQEEKLAFWVNAYNIGAIKMIIDHYPVKSIVGKKISLFRSTWKIKVLNIGGEDYTLDTIEHGILIDKLEEPMAHFGIVCASVSCPNLQPVPYEPDTVYQQLEAAARVFLNDKTKGANVNWKTGIVAVSKIFDWSSKDFLRIGGLPDLFKRYLADEEEKNLIKSGEFRAVFLEYNWKLNDTKFTE